MPSECAVGRVVAVPWWSQSRHHQTTVSTNAITSTLTNSVTGKQTAWCQVVSAPPASTSLDQEFVEDFGRFFPVERLSWTIVELVGDGVELGLWNTRPQMTGNTATLGSAIPRPLACGGSRGSATRPHEQEHRM